MRFETVVGRWQRAELSQVEAAEILGVTERTFRRWYQRYEEDGLDGLLDRRLGKPSAKRVPEAWMARLEQLYRERYAGFNAKHFWEHLVKDHHFPFSYSWAKSFLHRRQLVPLTTRKGTHRKKRPRRPMVGMMLHQDGSRHRWVPGLDASFDLIVTMDDATSEIYSAFLVEEEGTMSSLAALRAVIAEHGLFCSLYTDRGSHYFETPAAGGKVDPDHPTQVGRALRARRRRHLARGALRAGRPCRRQRQHRALSPSRAAAAGEPAAPALRQSQGARSSLSRRHPGRLSRSPLPGPLHQRRCALRSCSSSGRLKPLGAPGAPGSSPGQALWICGRSAPRNGCAAPVSLRNTGTCSPSPTSPQGQPQQQWSK